MVDYERHIASDVTWIGEGQRLGSESLSGFLARVRRFAVAFSGGCDSAFLLAAAREAGCEVSAYLVKTAFQPTFEFEDALKVAKALSVDLNVIELDILANDAVCANGDDRCYQCKKLIFSTILEHAARDGFEVLVDGTNASDDPARRPGYRALAELGVMSPLRRAGMSKAEVREASGALEEKRGLPAGTILADKPSFPCLAVYVSPGERITDAQLDDAAARRGVAR